VRGAGGFVASWSQAARVKDITPDITPIVARRTMLIWIILDSLLGNVDSTRALLARESLLAVSLDLDSEPGSALGSQNLITKLKQEGLCWNDE